METPHHLILRPSGYYFRLVLPKALRPFFAGKSEVRRSLGTASRYLATQMAARLWAHLQLEFEKVMAQDDWRNLISGQFSVHGLSMRNGAVTIKKADVNGAKDRKELAEFMRELSQMVSGQQAQVPQPTMQAAAVPSEQPALRGSARLSLLIPKFLAEHKAKGTTADQHNKFVSALGMMAEIIGDKDVNHVSNDDVNLVRETLPKVPKHRNNSALFKGKSLSECIRLADSLGKPRLDINTVDFNIQKMAAFFAWARLHGHLEGPNRFEGKTFRSRRERLESSNRTAFTDGDLKSIFAAYSKVKDPAVWWLSLMGLYSGARIGELAQMYRRDICPVLDKTSGASILTLFVRAERPDQSVKTPNAVRLVPVHSALLELGFLDYLQDLERLGYERLFPHIPLSSKGTYANEASKRFAKFLDDVVGIQDPGKVFHSFRYTMLDAVKQAGEVDYELRCEVAGHQLDNVASEVYTNKSRIGRKKQAVESIRYEGLDLTALKYQPGKFDKFYQSFEKRQAAKKAKGGAAPK